MKIAKLPQNDLTNGWSNILPTREPHVALAGDLTADWLVIGGGYAGLSAARRLAENRPDESVVLVEAGICGENASGRNSGFAIDIPHTVSSSMDELESAHSYMRLSRAAVDRLESIVTTHSIACDWSRDGKYQTAVSARGSAALLEPLAASLDALGEPWRWVEADELRRVIGSDHFHRAVYTPGCVLMNPAALVRGLADTMPGNVKVFENTPATAIEYSNGVSITTAGGAVRAPRLIMAANGFSEQFGLSRGKFVHLAAHGSLTRPLTDAQAAAYGVETPWGLTPANAVAGITMRYTNDRRILIRQTMELNSANRTSLGHQARVAARHKTLFADRFPAIADVELEHTWVGYVCMSRNGSPAFGQLKPNVWIAACQNAIGVTKGTISGLLVADMACGVENPLIADMQGLGTPDDLPPQWMVEVGARAKIGYEVWRNRHEA